MVTALGGIDVDGRRSTAGAELGDGWGESSLEQQRSLNFIAADKKFQRCDHGIDDLQLWKKSENPSKFQPISVRLL